MARIFLVLAAASGLLAVVLGAFGAHSLKGRVSETLFSAFQTAVQYHFYHTLALLAVALLLQRTAVQGWLIRAGVLFVIGVLLFSGSLYAIALGAPHWLGPVTPIGGLCFMVGWVCLLISALRMSK